jgi:hypothetical protein
MAGGTYDPQLANELRNELTVIIGQCEMLEDTPSARSPVLAHIKAIKTAALRMAGRISHQPWPGVNVTQQTKKRRYRSH